MDRKLIRALCYSMKEGQAVVIKRLDFNEAFGPLCGFPSMYETSIQAFLSGMVGSAYGTFQVDENLMTGDLIISRHPASERLVYVDPDRAHLFKRTPDGFLEFNP